MSEQDTGLHVLGPEAYNPDRTEGSGWLRLRAGRRLARLVAITLGAATGLAIAVFLLMDSPLLQTLVWGSPAPRPSAHSLLPGRGPAPGLGSRHAELTPGNGVRGPGPGMNGVPGSGSGLAHDSGRVPPPWQVPGTSDSGRPAERQREIAVPGQQAGVAAGSGPLARDHGRLPASSRDPARTGDGAGNARGQSAGGARDLLPVDLRNRNTSSAYMNRDRLQPGPGAGTDAAGPGRGSGRQASGTVAGTGPLSHSAPVPAPVDGPATGAAAVTGSADPSGTRAPSLLADLEAMQVRAFRLRMLLEENTLRARICETSKPAFRPVWCVETPPAPAIAAAPSRAPRRAAVPPAPELLGVAGSRSALAALLRLEGRTLRLREGERAGAWRVNRIGADGAVTMSHPSGRRVDLRVGG